jgi:hypothetical protein
LAKLKHLATLIEEMQALDVALVTFGETAGRPPGKLQLHILAALAEFERPRIQEPIRAGLPLARAQAPGPVATSTPSGSPQSQGCRSVSRQGGWGTSVDLATLHPLTRAR